MFEYLNKLNINQFTMKLKAPKLVKSIFQEPIASQNSDFSNTYQNSVILKLK